MVESGNLVTLDEAIQPTLYAIRHQDRRASDHALYQQHASAGGKTRVGGGQVPLPQLLTVVSAVRILCGLDRVVDDEAVVDQQPASEEVMGRGLEIDYVISRVKSPCKVLCTGSVNA